MNNCIVLQKNQIGQRQLVSAMADRQSRGKAWDILQDAILTNHTRLYTSVVLYIGVLPWNPKVVTNQNEKEGYFALN